MCVYLLSSLFGYVFFPQMSVIFKCSVLRSLFCRLLLHWDTKYVSLVRTLLLIVTKSMGTYLLLDSGFFVKCV